ncbi:MAG: BlaI/MecI/CopY family transcriptional regulator [Pseudomonadales bacterium]|nr:BlaI/MecI/CopY family transcriptional regulator [Pseudomonadales bacterium]MEE2893002.1 BlaI/MecI/CopY family transcriptional regulator [Pseudomonadota bacterium]
MAKTANVSALSRRERQIMDVLFERREATAAEIRARIPDPPSYSAVRALVRTLEEKGYVDHVQDGPRYVYRPLQARETARAGAVERLLRTFFDGSVTAAVAGLLDRGDAPLSDDELDELERLVRAARAQGEAK